LATDEKTLKEGLSFDQFKTFVHANEMILKCFVHEPQPEPEPEPEPEAEPEWPGPLQDEWTLICEASRPPVPSPVARS